MYVASAVSALEALFLSRVSAIRSPSCCYRVLPVAAETAAAAATTTTEVFPALSGRPTVLHRQNT